MGSVWARRKSRAHIFVKWLYYEKKAAILRFFSLFCERGKGIKGPSLKG